MYRDNENVTKLGYSGGYRVLKTTQLFNLKAWILGHMNYIFSHYLGWDTFQNTKQVPETGQYRILWITAKLRIKMATNQYIMCALGWAPILSGMEWARIRFYDAKQNGMQLKT